MHLSKIYVSDNFVPDVVTDQYRRRVIGIEVTFKEGENVKDAEAAGEEYIKDYIKRNTVEQHFSGITERIVKHQEEPLSQVDSIIRDIASCNELKVLESYRLIAKSNPQIQEAYDNQYTKLST